MGDLVAGIFVVSLLGSVIASMIRQYRKKGTICNSCTKCAVQGICPLKTRSGDLVEQYHQSNPLGK